MCLMQCANISSSDVRNHHCSAAQTHACSYTSVHALRGMPAFIVCRQLYHFTGVTARCLVSCSTKSARARYATLLALHTVATKSQGTAAKVNTASYSILRGANFNHIFDLKSTFSAVLSVIKCVLVNRASNLNDAYQICIYFL